MSQTGKLMHNLDQKCTKILNLTVLERMDPYIEEILITAAHVTFYEFNVDLNQWSSKLWTKKHGFGRKDMPRCRSTQTVNLKMSEISFGDCFSDCEFS
uniref:Putative mRNA-decapping enzyme subunit 1, PH domain-like protein n=1 Tax=Helianthus annuus TaxID=4232 RepID=A0A251TLB2_HELAN